MLVMLAGPIKCWWESWGSPLHRDYLAFRDALSQALVDAGYLVYRPHEAWKGEWNEAAQRVNDAAIYACDLVINMTPPGAPSEGTDLEMHLCRYLGKDVIWATVGAPIPGILKRVSFRATA